MGNLLGLTKDGDTKKEEVSGIDIPAESEKARWRVLHRVPLQVRENKKHIYGGLSSDEYDDEALAEMMLRDACFVLYCMEGRTGVDDEKRLHIIHRLGASGAAFLYRDFAMLENQIPLWVVKLLITSTFDHDDDKAAAGEALLCNFLSHINFGDHKLARVPWEVDENKEPLHLVEAHRAALVKEEIKSSTSEVHTKRCCHWRKSPKISTFQIANCPSRSVTELKAKGSHFEPSSNCLKDIRFTSYAFYGKLQLPIRYISYNTKVFFSNYIAFEMSPEIDTDFAVISYIDFMKSLIESPKDVKELREKGILFSRLANDEEVVRMYKEIDTYGFYNQNMFLDVKKRIHEHCNSKTKTWMAELAYTYFRSPWTAMALFAATFLLCLTFLQTYYTMSPRNSGKS